MNIADCSGGNLFGDAEASKPEPDIFERRLRKSAIPMPNRCVVIGDTRTIPLRLEKSICEPSAFCGFPERSLTDAGVEIYKDPAGYWLITRNRLLQRTHQSG